MPSFPDTGESIPASSPGSNISFSQLRDSWFNNDNNFSGLSDPGDETNISLSEFNNAKLSDGTTISNASGLSIKNDFCGKTFLIPVTGVTLNGGDVTDTTPDESTTISNYATAVIAPSNANGTLTIEFTTASGGGASATPASTGYQSASAGSNTMNYTFSSVTSHTNVNNITVNVKQNGGSIIATVNSSSIIIQETGGGGSGSGSGSGKGGGFG